MTTILYDRTTYGTGRGAGRGYGQSDGDGGYGNGDGYGGHIHADGLDNCLGNGNGNGQNADIRFTRSGLFILTTHDALEALTFL